MTSNFREGLEKKIEPGVWRALGSLGPPLLTDEASARGLYLESKMAANEDWRSAAYRQKIISQM